MPNNVLGVPAALLWLLATLLFVIVVIVVDYIIIARNGEDYSITYGWRWLYLHYPLITTMAIFAGGFLIGGLMVHLSYMVYVPAWIRQNPFSN